MSRRKARLIRKMQGVLTGRVQWVSLCTLCRAALKPTGRLADDTTKVQPMAPRPSALPQECAAMKIEPYYD